MNKNLQKFLKGSLLSIFPLLFFAFFVFGSQIYISAKAKGEIEDKIFLSSMSEAQNLELEMDEDFNKDIDANACISVETNLDENQKIIFEKDSNTKFPIASLTKLMTAVVVLDNYDLSQKIILSREADLQAPMKTDFKLGDNFTIKNYLYTMLIESSNKAAFALSEKMGKERFVDLMNQKAKDVGLQNTYFADPTGLSSENVSTINDLVIFTKFIIKNYPVIAEISTIKKYELPNFGEIENTDQLLIDFPEIILSKTGFTNEANGCLLVVLNNSKNNNYFINIILGSGDRFLEMKKLINQ
jgi:D-alanyl-D-alanine carboxypeptidase